MQLTLGDDVDEEVGGGYDSTGTTGLRPGLIMEVFLPLTVRLATSQVAVCLFC